MLANVRVHGCAQGGIYWNGPHDSQWVNVVVYRCGPPGDSGSTTKGVEARQHSAGLRVTNCHVWGTNHAHAWYLDCEAPGLVNCTGEGAEQAQVVLLGNDSQIVGGKYFGARDLQGNRTVGIQIGVADVNPAPAGTFVNTKVVNCDLGSLRFENDSGIGRYLLSIWQSTGYAVAVRAGLQISASNRFDLQVSGGAKTGNLAGLRPISFSEDVLGTRGIEVRGDVRAGSPTSKLGFFGAPLQIRSTGWSVGNLPDARDLDGGADLAQVRAVLATLLRELRRYGLLANQGPSGKP
jgi:peptidoglycan hydrolase-like protein with peptidoglycan-binding domain